MQGPRLGQQAHQQHALGVLVERRVGGFDASLQHKLGQRLLVTVRGLAEVYYGQVEAEHLDGAEQRPEPQGDDGRPVVAVQRGDENAEVGGDLLRPAIGRQDRAGLVGASWAVSASRVADTRAEIASTARR